MGVDDQGDVKEDDDEDADVSDDDDGGGDDGDGDRGSGSDDGDGDADNDNGDDDDDDDCAIGDVGDADDGLQNIILRKNNFNNQVLLIRIIRIYIWA